MNKVFVSGEMVYYREQKCKELETTLESFKKILKILN